MKNRKSEREDYGYLEEDGQSSVAMIIGGIVLLVIIVVLCAMIWKLFHSDDSKPSQGIGQTAQETFNDTLKETGSSIEEMGSSMEGTEGVKQSDEDGNEGDAQGSDGQADDGQQSAGQQDDNSVLNLTFQEVDETVTAKDVTNLRSVPSTERDDTVVTQLKNGETARRTGINDAAGWSRLEYNGQVLYAATRLLTTELSSGTGGASESGTTAGQQSSTLSQDDTVTTSTGRVITFTDCDDTISAKIVANLRLEPSSAQENASIHCQLEYGQTAHRTGYDEASGWSRVEYDGKVLYTVTSLIYVVEETTDTQ